MAKKSKVLLPALLMGAKEMLSALKSVAGWAMAHKFLAGVIAGCVLLLSVSQSNRRGEYYFRTADELRYLQDLRQKYSGAKYMLTKEEAEAAIAQACSFLSKCGGGSPAYDTPQARDLLFGTAIAESGLAPRFQDSEGDAIGLFQIEYGTYRDILNRVLKKNNPLLYESILSHFGNGGKISFEDLQTKNALSAVFARLKYAQSGVLLPEAGDYAAQGAYYKKYYNTHLGKGSVSNFVRKRIEYENGAAVRSSGGVSSPAKAASSSKKQI